MKKCDIENCNGDVVACCIGCGVNLCFDHFYTRINRHDAHRSILCNDCYERIKDSENGHENNNVTDKLIQIESNISYMNARLDKIIEKLGELPQ